MAQSVLMTKGSFRRVTQLLTSRVYFNPGTETHRSILVAGTARSGTTWLGDLIASQIPCRIMFEPFHPLLVPEFRTFHYFEYSRPDAENPKLHAFAQRIFKGEIRNRWIDHKNERVFSKYRLIKEIRANLSLKWLHDNFPEVPVIFLMRHPCAVVASRLQLGWATDRDIEPFLSQLDLIEDHLTPFMSLILNAKTAEEKHAIIWCVSNLVPLRQFKTGKLKVIYYEHLCTQPEIVMPSIISSIGAQYTPPAADAFNKPSQTTRRKSAIVRGADKTSSWRKILEPPQIKNVLRIVDRFGLDHLYGDSLLPLVA